MQTQKTSVPTSIRVIRPSTFYWHLLLFLALSSTLSAQTYKTWIGAVSTDFQDASNWDNAVPVSTTVGYFTGTPTSNQPDLLAATSAPTVSGLHFASESGGWTFSSSSGQAIAIYTANTNGAPFGISTIGQTSGTNTINANISVGISTTTTTQNWSVGTGGTLIINGTLAGSSVNSGLQIGTAGTGAGTLVLTGTNTRKGATYLRAGTIRLGKDNGLGDGAVTVLGTANDGVGATLASNTGSGARSLNNTIGLEAGATLTIGGSATDKMTLGGIISGAGNLTVASSATLSLTANNTYAGATTINSGATLELGNGGAVGGLAATGGGIILSGGTLAINRSDAITINNANNQLSGNGVIRNTGSGTTQFSGTSTFTGDVEVQSGRISVLSANALGGPTNTGTFRVSSGAIMSFSNGSLSRRGDVVNNGTLLMVNTTTGTGLTFYTDKSVTGSGTFKTSAVKTGDADFTFLGTVAPGTADGAAGSFTFGDGQVAATVQFGETSTTIWNLTGTGGVAGTDYDAFTLAAGSNGANAIIVDGATLQIALTKTWDHADAWWQTDHTFALFSTSSVAGTFALTNNTYTGNLGTGVFTFDGQNIQYTFTAAVPEPGASGIVFGLAVVITAVLLMSRQSLRTKRA